MLLCSQVYSLYNYFADHFCLGSKSRLVQVSWYLFIHGTCRVAWVNKLEEKVGFLLSVFYHTWKSYKNNFLNMRRCKFPSPVLFLDLQCFEYDISQKIIVFLKPPTGGVHLIWVIQSKCGGPRALWKSSVTGMQHCLLPSPGHVLLCGHLGDFLGLLRELCACSSRIQLPDSQKYTWTQCSVTICWFWVPGRRQTFSQGCWNEEVWCPCSVRSLLRGLCISIWTRTATKAAVPAVQPQGTGWALFEQQGL